jgi:predicted RNA binding protein YcfA (HicA-like mRNA interferase family)
LKTARNISGKELVKLLKVYGYEIVRQNGSHITVTTERYGQHHLAIPNHNPIKTATLNGIISRVALHFKIEKQEVFNKLF